GVRLSAFGCLCRDQHNPRSPWPGSARPSTPSFRSTERVTKTWVAGTSPATRASKVVHFFAVVPGCLQQITNQIIVTRNLFIGVPYVGRELPIAARPAPDDDIFPD